MIHEFRDSLSRIARYFDRPAEATAHAASSIAVLATVMMVGTGQVTETNPVSAWVQAWAGVEVWAVLTPFLVASLFELACRVPWSYIRDRIRWGFAIVLTLDAIGNISIMAIAGLPESVYWKATAPPLLEVVIFTLAVYSRHAIAERAPNPPLPSREATRAVGLSIIILTAIPAGVVFVGTQPLPGSDNSSVASASHSKPLIDGFEDNDTAGWVNAGKLVVESGGDGVTPASGDYHAEYTASDTDTSRGIPNVTENATVGAQVYFNDTSQTQFITLQDDGTASVSLRVSSGNWQVFKSGSWVTLTSATQGSYTDLDVDLNPENNSFTVSIDGSTFGPYNSSDTTIRGTDEFHIRHAATSPEALYIDDITSTAPVFHGDGFENQTADSGAPENWNVLNSSAAMNVTTRQVIEGSQSFGIDASPSNTMKVKRERYGPTTANFSGSIYANPNATMQYHLYEGGSKVIDVEYVASTSTLRVRDSSNSVTEVATISPEQWINLTVTEIDPSSDTFALDWGTGNKSGLAMFTGMKDGYDTVRLRTDNGQGFYDDIDMDVSKKSSKTVSGRVVTQSGAPIENATVPLVVSKKPTTPKAQDQLEDLSDPTPSGFTDQQNNGFEPMSAWRGTDAYYAGIYSTEDIATKPWIDNADLQDPMWRQVETNEELALVVGDASGDNCGILSGTNEYNRQLPGCTVGEEANAEVELKRLAATGETTQTHTFELNQQAGGGFGDPSSLQYARVPADSLQPGYYVVTPDVEASDNEHSYIIRYGTPSQIVNQYRETVEGKATQQAQEVSDAISSGGIETVTVTTNETGHWSADVASNAVLVQVQAYKAPGIDTPPANLNYGNISSGYEQGVTNQSVYMPSRTYRVEPPADDVTIRMQELTYPPIGGNISDMQDQLEELRDLLQNRSLAGSIPATLQNQSNLTRTQLETTYEGQLSLIENNDQIREVFLDLSGRDSVPNPDDLTRSELVDAIRHANQAISAVESTSPDDVETSATSNTVSVAWTDEIADGAEVTVWAEYSNGTKTKVPDEYVSVDTGFGSDTIRVSEYPLGDTDPAAVSFRLQAAGENQVIEDTKSVTNPAFDGEVPGLNALDYSTLRPGPDEQVTVTVRGGDEFANVSNVNVIGPDGDSIPATLDGNEVTFKTSGQGQHKIRYTVKNLGGDKFTAVSTVRAVDSDQVEEPTVAARENVLGAYAVVGSAFESGSVSATSDKTTIRAQLPDDAEAAPSRMHVHAEDLTPQSDNIEVQIVQGPDQQSIDEHVLVYIHEEQLDEGTLVWRGEDEPITRAGDTKYGEISTDSDGTTITTYTSADGELQLEVVRDPTTLERVDHRIDRITATTSIPFVGTYQPPTMDEAPHELSEARTAVSDLVGTPDAALPAAGWVA